MSNRQISLSASSAREAARNTSNGQFGEQNLAEPHVDLAPPVNSWAARREQLLSEGYVPAIAHRTGIAPGSTRDSDLWWDQHFVDAELGGVQGEVPKMPDDETPSATDGRSVAGYRRTHRMRYSGADIDVRMPSATAIRRFARNSGKSTFDVPITMTRHDGSAVAGWVRVSGSGDTWNADAFGFDGYDQWTAGEAVAAVREARRAMRALTSRMDLMAADWKRLAQQGSTTRDLDTIWRGGDPCAVPGRPGCVVSLVDDWTRPAGSVDVAGVATFSTGRKVREELSTGRKVPCEFRGLADHSRGDPAARRGGTIPTEGQPHVHHHQDRARPPRRVHQLRRRSDR